MRPVRPESTSRSVGRVSKKVGALQRRDAGGTTDWVEFVEPYDNDWEWPGGTAVKAAWKLNPNPGKHPFLRGAVQGGVSGTSPFTLPDAALVGAPFDGDFITALAFTTEDGIAITKVDVDGVVYVTTFTVGDAGDVSFDPSGTGLSSSDVQAALAELAGVIDGLASVYQAKDSTLDTYAGIDPSSNIQSILGAANYAAIRTLLALVTGTDVQAYDADLAAFAGLSIAADKLPYGTGSHTLGLTDLSSFIRTVLDDADAPTARATLGVIASLFQSGGAQAIKLDDLDTPDDNTDLDASTGHHGLLPTLRGGTTDFLREDGTWAAPPGTGGGGGAGAPEINVRALELIPSASGGASGPNAGAFGTKTVVTMDFVNGADTTAECDVQMPPDWDGGPLKGEVSWFAGGTDPDDVEFGVELLSLGDGDPDDSFGTEVTIDDTHPADAATLAVTELSDNVTPAGTPAIGNRMFVRLTRHGATDELAQTVKVLGLRLAYTQGDIVPPPTIPEWISTGTPAAVSASPGDIVLAYPDLIHEDDLLIAQIYSRSGSATLDTVPAGWSAMPISGMPDTQSSVMRQWYYYKWADGTETTSDSETWSATLTLPFLGRVHCFRGVDMSTMLESTAKASAANTTVAHASITSTADNRLAVCMYCSPDDHGTSVFTGQTGGTWEAAGTDFTTTLGSDAMFGMQTADMPTAGTISGGTFTLTGGSANAWIARTFALIPIGG